MIRFVTNSIRNLTQNNRLFSLFNTKATSFDRAYIINIGNFFSTAKNAQAKSSR
jgi:hypothetical protein